MKFRKNGWLLIGALSFGVVSAEASPRLGAALLLPDSTACVTFSGELRKVGDHVNIIVVSPPRVVDGVILARLNEACNKADDQQSLSYAVRLRHTVDNTGAVGIAIYDPTARVQYENGAFIVHTADAKNPLTFRECTSSEGLHLTAWRGGRRTWHKYWNLEMDLQPNCTEDQTKP